MPKIDLNLLKNERIPLVESRREDSLDALMKVADHVTDGKYINIVLLYPLKEEGKEQQNLIYVTNTDSVNMLKILKVQVELIENKLTEEFKLKPQTKKP